MREGVVPERDVRRCPGRGDDRPHHLEAGRVAERVNDAPVAVPAFAGERELAIFLVELRAPRDELLDLRGRLADDEFDDLAIAQPVARDERVFDVVLEAILRREHAREPALGVGAVALGDAVLRDDEDGEVCRDFERRAQARDAGADHEHVGEAVERVAGVERDEVAVGGHDGPGVGSESGSGHSLWKRDSRDPARSPSARG